MKTGLVEHDTTTHHEVDEILILRLRVQQFDGGADLHHLHAFTYARFPSEPYRGVATQWYYSQLGKKKKMSHNSLGSVIHVGDFNLAQGVS